MLLSHAHVDHNGCLGFLKPEIPVYTGLMTAMMGRFAASPHPRRLELFGEPVPSRLRQQRRADKCERGRRR